MSINADRLRTEGVYQVREPLSDVTSDLLDIEMACSGWTGYRKRVRWISTAALILGIPFLFGLKDAGLFGALGLLMIAGAICGYVHAYSYARSVVGKQNRCGVLRSFTALLREDTGKKSPVSVRMAFADGRALLSDQDWPIGKNGKERLYKDAWLSVETELLDGTTCSGTVTDLIRERTCVTPRGRSKRKIRTRHVVAMRFSYRAELYGNASETGAKLKDAIKLPPGAALKGVEVTDRDIKLKAIVDKTEDLTQANSMLALGAYRMLNLARKAKGAVQ